MSNIQSSLGIFRGTRAVLVAAILLAVIACGADIAAPTPSSVRCPRVTTTTASAALHCLVSEGRLSAADGATADSLLLAGRALADSVAHLPGPQDLNRSYEAIRAEERLIPLFAAGWLDDSARVHRLLQHVRVTHEYLRYQLIIQNSAAQRYISRSYPGLIWQYYPNEGLHLTPVTSVQVLFWILPTAAAPTDSLEKGGEALWREAVWYTPRKGMSFPRWEYTFSFTSGGIDVTPPWVSGMSQGYILALYSELAARTASPIWRNRADAVYRSFQHTWDDGGVLLPDTSEGYWWDEYGPLHHVWNGSAEALLGVGHYANVTRDASALEAWHKGLNAMRLETPYYDTGYWTLYSRVQGLNTRAYHALHIQLADAIFAQSDEAWAKVTADRWRTYTPPSGVP